MLTFLNGYSLLYWLLFVVIFALGSVSMWFSDTLITSTRLHVSVCLTMGLLSIASSECVWKWAHSIRNELDASVMITYVSPAAFLSCFFPASVILHTVANQQIVAIVAASSFVLGWVQQTSPSSSHLVPVMTGLTHVAIVVSMLWVTYMNSSYIDVDCQCWIWVYMQLLPPIRCKSSGTSTNLDTCCVYITISCNAGVCVAGLLILILPSTLQSFAFWGFYGTLLVLSVGLLVTDSLETCAGLEQVDVEISADSVSMDVIEKHSPPDAIETVVELDQHHIPPIA